MKNVLNILFQIKLNYLLSVINFSIYYLFLKYHASLQINIVLLQQGYYLQVVLLSLL